jgi:hypothetical protein
MYQAQAALKQFFSGFGIPAYTEDTVPEDVSLPYITYAAGQPEWDQKRDGCLPCDAQRHQPSGYL